MGAWTPEAVPTSTGGGAVTLVEGSSFCICTPDGAVVVGAPHGVDVRHEWCWSHGAAAQA